ncbi:MAG: hypothetical protein NTX64_16415, partial [Elusimicrobia bacterium]|nr:hypothetical protein [Elusimicrobiota bacterium]
MRGAFGAGAVLALAAAFARPAAAVPTNTGGNTAEFLTLGAGARALGMGDAYGPVAEGPDAMYWNPAGLAALTQPEMSFTHSEMNTFFRHEYASYAHPVEALGGTMGGAATVWSMDPIQGLNYAGQQTGAFAPHSEAFSIGFAKSFWEHNDIPTR